MYIKYTPFQCNFDLVTNLGTSDEKFILLIEVGRGIDKMGRIGLRYLRLIFPIFPILTHRNSY